MFLKPAKMAEAWAMGLTVLVGAIVLWATCLEARNYSQLALGVLLASPLIASALAAYVAPHRKALIGVLMAVPFVLMLVLFNAMYQLIGRPVDFSGVAGAITLAVASLAWALPMSALGAAIGQFVIGRVFTR